MIASAPVQSKVYFDESSSLQDPTEKTDAV